MATRLGDRRQYLRRVEFIALSALPIDELPMVASPPIHHDGVMVALVPTAPEQLAIDHPEALPPTELHVTLCYLGKVQNLSSTDQTKILAQARKACDEAGQAFNASADGVIVMGQNEDGVPATALLIQSDEIVSLYDAMAKSLAYQSNYPSFIPHMTTGYGVPVEAAQEHLGQPIDFNTVIVKFGDAIHRIPLQSAMVAAPRGANTIDRVVDSLGRLWDEALHPRDGEGKFIKKNGAVSGKLSVPSADRKTVNLVDANRASVVGFKTIGNDVWVLAEIQNSDGSKLQGFAKAAEVRAVAPVKARLDALYPISKNDDFVDSSLERQRQLDLILAHINKEYGPSNDESGAFSFLESLGLSDTDLDYVISGDSDYLGGIQKTNQELDADELDELADIISDAQQIKTLRDRVHGLSDEHVVPQQQILTGEGPDQDVVTELKAGADPLAVKTDNLLAAMTASGRFEHDVPTVATGISPIMWFTDSGDQTEHDAYLAGLGRSTTDRAYFVKTSVFGAEYNNVDVAHEVLASLIAENAVRDDRSLLIPKAVFGDNPEWDGVRPEDDFGVQQPGHVVSQHAAYLVPSDWKITDAFTETVNLQNDVKDADILAQDDMIAAFNEDMGNLYGNDSAKMILFDYAIMNGDRNPNNALLASSPDGQGGRVLPIDHGMAFEADPFDQVDDELIQGDLGSLFEWFMRYPPTRGWLDYVRGGLRLDDNVTEDSLRQIIADFADVYGNLDADAIVGQFTAIPGVTEKQVDRIRRDMAAVLDRIAWVVDNQDAVFNGLTTGRIS